MKIWSWVGSSRVSCVHGFLPKLPSYLLLLWLSSLLWFCWMTGGWFWMHKVAIAVTDVVLDDTLLIDIVVKVLKIGSFVVVDRCCPVRRRWWFADHVVGIARLAFRGFPHLWTRFTGGSWPRHLSWSVDLRWSSPRVRKVYYNNTFTGHMSAVFGLCNLVIMRE